MNTYILIHGVFARLVDRSGSFITIQTKPDELHMLPALTPYEEILILDEEVPQLQMSKDKEMLLA